MCCKKHIIWLILFVFYGSFAATVPENCRFIENKGQWHEKVRYAARTNYGNIFFTDSTFTFLFVNGDKLGRHQHCNHTETSCTHQHSQNLPDAFAYQMRFLAANPEVVKAEKPFETNYNYFRGNNPEKWVSGAKAYRKITYQQLYNGIDLQLYETKEGLKYDFIVAPQHNPNLIQIAYEGQSSLHLNPKTQTLTIETPLAKVTETGLLAYQVIAGKRQIVPCRWKLIGNTVSFEFPQGYDNNYELVIDPTLIFSTYSGSSGDNWGNTATYDSKGNGYAAGTVFWTGFPANLGVQAGFDTSYNGTNIVNFLQVFSTFDVGILKFSADGTQLLYASYLGGIWAEAPHSIVVDNQDNLIVMGSTASQDFPNTPTAFDTSFNFGQFLRMGTVSFRYNLGSDIFITKIAENGSQILASTFVGGTNNDAIRTEKNILVRNYGDELRGDVIVDSANNVYVATYTSSSDFPMINSFQPFFGGGTTDGVVFKMNADLSEMIWSNYIGGPGEDALYSIQLDSFNNVIVAGGTSGTITTTPNTIHPFKTGGIDGFVSIISANGSQLLHSTYIGTPELDQVYFVQLDQYDNVYVTGQTFGNYPIFTLEDSIYANIGAGHFLHKLNKELSFTIFSTTFGAENSPPQLSLTAFLVDDCDRIYITGWGGGSNQPSSGTFYIGNFTFGLPVTPNVQGYVDTVTDGSDFYMMVLSRNARELQYGSFFGEDGGIGDHVDGGTCRFDKNGTIYHAVCASCGGTNGFPITPNAWSSVNKGRVYRRIPNCNNALFKIGLAPEILELFFIPASGCAPLLAQIKARDIGNANITWHFGNGDSITGNNLYELDRLFTNPGLYTIEMTVNSTNACLVATSISDTLRVFPVPQFDDRQVNFCPNDTLQLAFDNNAQNTHVWSPSLYLNDSTAFNPIAVPDSSITYTVSITSPRGCSTTRQVELRKSVPIVQDTSAFLCQGDTLLFTLQNGGLYQLNWQPFNNLSHNNVEELLIWADTTTNYQVTAFDSLNCSKTIEVSVKVGFTEQVRDTNYVPCLNDSLILTSGVKIAAYEYTWWTGSDTLNGQSFELPIFAINDSVFGVIITDTNGCVKTENYQVITSFPQVQPDTALFFCENDVLQLGLGNNPIYQYEWLPATYLDNSTVFNPTATPDSSITYLVKISDSLNCQAIRNIALNMGLHTNFADTNLAFCKGETITLLLHNADSLFYEWSPAVFINDVFAANPTLQIDSTLTYLVKIRDSIGCEKSRNVAIVASQPQLAPDTTLLFCWNDTVALQAGSPIYSYHWSPTNFLNNANIHNPIATPQDTISYLVTARDSLNCLAQRIFNLQLAIPNFPNINQDFCWGTSFTPQHVPINENYRYEWLPNEFISDNTLAAPSFKPNRSMNYSLQVTEPISGCVLTRQFNVNKLPSTLQIASQFKYDNCGAYPIFTFRSNQNDTTGKLFTWYWQHESTQDSAVTVSLTRRFSQEGNQSILLKTVEPNGCTDSTVYNFVVKKLTIPNIVSPNGDGENDTWEIGGEGVKTVDLRVFSRWGKLVYEQSNYNNDWNAQDLPTGTYFYQLKIDNVANCTGWIQVMR